MLAVRKTSNVLHPQRSLISSTPNGDHLRLEYFELQDINAAIKRYAGDLPGFKYIAYPVTTVEITFDFGTPDLQIISSKTVLGKIMTGCFSISGRVGLSIS